jgi:uncharacterized protein with GYD domain
MLFLQISKHSPESCPIHNETTKKVLTDLTAKTDQLTKKYGIKVIGSWVSVPDHLIVMVFDAPNMEAMLKISMEPEMMAWIGYTTSELKPVMTLEETMKLIK